MGAIYFIFSNFTVRRFFLEHLFTMNEAVGDDRCFAQFQAFAAAMSDRMH